MSLLKKKILFFGSDHISTNTLINLIPPLSNKQLKVVCPPYNKPGTPLANFH